MVQQRKAKSQQGERIIREWLLAKGCSVAHLSDDGLLKLVSPLGQWRVPDFLVCRFGRSELVEAQWKFQASRSIDRDRDETGIDARTIWDFQHIQQATGLPVNLAVFVGEFHRLYIDKMDWLLGKASYYGGPNLPEPHYFFGLDDFRRSNSIPSALLTSEDTLW